MERWYVGDVMTREVVTVSVEMGFKEVADLMVRRSVSAVPVIDAQRRVLGVVSEADLLARLEYADRIPRHLLTARRMRTGRDKAAGETAGALMTAPAVTIRASESVTGAARRMEAARVKRLPVVDDEGLLVGIVSRRDLVRIYTRPDGEVRHSVEEGVLRSLCIDPSQLDIRVRAGIVTLGGQLDRRSTADIVLALTRATPGVVDVVDELSADFDDRSLTGSQRYRSHPFSAEPEAVDLH